MADFTNTAPPTVTGNRVVGGTLTATAGTWAPIPSGYTYAWERADDISGTNKETITGATGGTYTVAPADTAKVLRVGVYPVAPVASTDWLPTPPAALTSTGTISLVEVGSCTGNAQIYALYDPTYQHIVQNTGGIFMGYSHQSNLVGSAHQQYFTVQRSTNGGASFSSIYNSQTAGQPFGNPSVLVETDRNANVYVIQGHYNNVAYPGYWRVYKFTAPSYGAPTIIDLPTATCHNSGKVTAHYDQVRDWVWMAIWEDGRTTNELWAFDTNGVIKFNRHLFKPQTESQRIFAHYPLLEINKLGHIYVGWISVDFNLTDVGVQNYYDARVIWSEDNGTTWKGAGASTVSMPVNSDDTSITAVGVVDRTDPQHFIAHSSGSYGTVNFNWEGMLSINYCNAKLHAWYYGNHPDYHNGYARISPTTGAVELRNPHGDTDYFGSATDKIHPANNGSFTTDTSKTSRLYFSGMGAASTGDYNKVVVLKSDDSGTTWQTYAISAVVPFNPSEMNHVSTFRHVLSDGSIIGVLESQAPMDPTKIYFWKATPV